MTNDPHMYLSTQKMLRDFFFLNPFIVPLGPSPMSDTIQTNATTTSPCARVSVITVLPEHPEVLVGLKLMRGGRCMGSGVQYGTVRDPGCVGRSSRFATVVIAQPS